MATKKNKLSASNLKQIHSKKFTTKVIHIEIDEKIYDIEIDEVFKVSKIQLLLSELFEKQKYFTTIDEVFSIINFLPFLIIKYFTNVDVAKVEDFSEQLKVYEIMLDLGVAEKILENIPESEMKKIDSYIKRASANVKKFADDKDAMKELEGMFAELKEEEESEIESEETENEDK